MIDIHSHILPKLDDGSKSVDESVAMLKLLSEQDVTAVAATPHFYANRNSVEEFLFKRQQSYNILKPKLGSSLPQVFLGAEVKYYEGISRLNGLKRLCIGDTKLLLLEMPMNRWTEYTLRELSELSASGEYKVVLAHIERYIKYQSKDSINKIINSGIFVQANADYFISLGSRRKALGLLIDGYIHFLGSDCHDLCKRSPRLGAAAEYIKRKVGEDFFADMNQFAHSFFSDTNFV